MTAPLRQTPKARSNRALIKEIFHSDSPEKYAQSLPAQSTYLLIKSQGTESAGELIELLSRDQYQLCLDFDLWKKDRIHEDNFWEWLKSSDEENDLTPLKRLISSVDLKIIAFLLGKYVATTTFEEPTEEPPAPHWYTPDKGFTWVGIQIEDPEKHRLLGKLLAFIFEGNAELFYQLIAIPNASTLSELEESAYQEKLKRLQSEGIPDDERVHAITSPLPVKEVLAELRKENSDPAIEQIPVVEPLLFQNARLQPFSTFMEEVKASLHQNDLDILQSELTLIMNASVIRWNVELYDQEGLQTFLQQVQGALNIGLEILGERSEKTLIETYQTIGLQKIFRVGMHAITELRRIAHGVSQHAAERAVEDAPAFSILACTREEFPVLPLFFKSKDLFEENDGKLLEGHKAFERIAEVQEVQEYLKERFAN